MSYLLREPTAVLLAGASPALAARLSAVITGGTADEVAVASASVPDRIAKLAYEDVGCVVVCHETDVDVAAACRAVVDDEPLRPVVAYVSDEASLVELASVPQCLPLRDSVSDRRLQTVVDDAIDRFERRRRYRSESSILDTVLNDAEVSMYAKDRDGRHVRMADVQYGPDPADALGKTDLEVWGEGTPEVARKTYEDDLAVVESGDPIYEQEEKFEEEHYTYWSESTKVPWYGYDGDLRGLVGVSRGVTDRVECLQSLEEQRRLIEQFTSYVSHDLQTPLQVASGALELARETGDDAAFRKVERTLERMEETIDDLAELANQRADTQALRATSEDDLPDIDGIGTVSTPRLAALVRDIWDVVGVSSATLELAVPETATVTADLESLRPLLENLLKNAIDHTGSGVTIRVGLTDERGFFVADDGPGVPQADRADVLEEGYTTSESGTGTGLHIVREVVEENGWAIRITESRDGGARFEVGDCRVVSAPPSVGVSGSSVPLDAEVALGPADVDGSVTYVEPVDRWILTGGGRNLWGDTNECYLAYGTATPPVRIEARITRLDAIDAYSKAGLVVRRSTDADGPFGFFGQTGGHGTEIIWRTDREALTETGQLEEPASVYEWYRLDYVDGALTCSLSPDGSNWTPVDQRTLDLADDVLVGLGVCGHDNREESVADFDSVAAAELTRQ